MVSVSLVKKIKHGKPYWYIVKSARVNGKPRIVWQKYLGTPGRILELLEEPKIAKLKTFPLGVLGALLDANEDLGFVKSIDKYVEKRERNGLTVGQYMQLFILGRAEEHRISKSGLDKWVDDSYMPFIWQIPSRIPCQTYLDQMDYITDYVIEAVFTDMCKALISKGVSMKRLVFDITNVATNIEKGEKLPRTGPSKEKRFDKNLLAFGIAINEDNIPVFSEMHPGNESEVKVFSQIVKRLTRRIENLSLPVKDVVLSIDRGLNSTDNINDIMGKMHVIGGLKRNQLSELWNLSLSKFREHFYTTSKNHKVIGYETKRKVWGRTYRIILTYNEGTAIRQKERYMGEKKDFLREAEKIQKALISQKRGRKPTQQSIIRRLNKLIHNGRESVFRFMIGANLYSRNALTVWVDTKAEKKLLASFGKQMIFTDIVNWTAGEVVKAYNGKAMVEDDFKFLKDRFLISVMPEWHTKDSRINVHVFLCIVGLTMYRYLLWKLHDTEISVYELNKALNGIRVGFVVTKGGKKRKVEQVLEDMKPVSAKVFSKLNLGRFLGT